MLAPNRKTPFAKKSLGQNFLIDEDAIEKIVQAVAPSANDTIIEIGPGRGALTERLLELGASVTAIELDRELIQVLNDRFTGRKNLKLVEEDALQCDFNEVLSCHGSNISAKLVANLPYYISTAILQRLAEQRDCFSSLVLMFQREVVERIIAQPGNSERGFLTVIVENAFTIEHLFDVPPSSFRPAPKVWSSVIRLLPKQRSILDEIEFRELLSTAFAQKRKTIANNLKAAYPSAVNAMTISEIAEKRRAETLSLNEWLGLYKAIRNAAQTGRTDL